MAVTITSTVTPGKTFANGETVTPTKLNLTGAPTTATTITLATDKLLGRVSASTGAVEEVTCTDFAQSLLDDAAAADARTTLGLGTIAVQDGTALSATHTVSHFTPTTLTFASTTDIDLSAAANTVQTVTLAGNVTFTTSNKASGRSKLIRIVGDGSARNLTFPAWKFMGTVAPSTLAASKSASLLLVCYGTADTDIHAFYSVEP